MSADLGRDGEAFHLLLPQQQLLELVVPRFLLVLGKLGCILSGIVVLERFLPTKHHLLLLHLALHLAFLCVERSLGLAE